METGCWVGGVHQREMYLTRPGTFIECFRSEGHSSHAKDYTGSNTSEKVQSLFRIIITGGMIHIQMEVQLEQMLHLVEFQVVKVL